MGATGFSDWLGRFGVGSRADARPIPSAGGHYAEFGCPAAAIDSRDLVIARHGIGALHLSLRALSEGLARVASRGHWSREEPGATRRRRGLQKPLKIILISALFCGLTPALALASPPQVLSESALNVTDSAATLEGEVQSETPGAVYFEYGTTTGYGSRVPVGRQATPAGVSSQSDPVAGLQSDTVYHYRVTLVAGTETIRGEDETFTTQTNATGFTLPDNRAWELVSPPEKSGARIEPITKEGGLIQAAQDGSAITYVANAPVGEHPEGNPSLAMSQVMSIRKPGGGWSSRDLATPHAHEPAGVEVGQLEEYYAFTPDLTKGIVEPKGPAPQLAANASENSIFIRENLREPIGADYTALINNENTAPGTHYGNRENNLKAEYAAASGNLEHVVVVSVTPLTAAYPTGGYYEWSGGVLTPVVVLPNGEFPSFKVAKIGDYNFNVRNAVSEDGDHVFFTFELDGAERHLYVRDVALGRTVQIDLPQGVGPSSERPQPVFSYATPDGERVYFTDDQRLTGDATAEEGRSELYEYNTSSGVLTDLTPDTSEGIGSAVGGEVIGASPDGEYLYFVANGVLAAGAQPGEPNLYVERVTPGGDVISLITILSGADSHDTGSRELTETTARVSPNGRFLAFMSSRALTGYDNTNAGSTVACGQGGVCDQEVFEYDAVNGKLSCASCDPTGARPHGVLDILESGEGLGLLVDRPKVWEGSWLAGSVPGWTEASPRLEQSNYQSKYLGDGGRLFFTSPDSLVSQDTNGKEDVYEYEPEGVGSCGAGVSSGSVAYKPAHAFHGPEGAGEEPAGCVSLISSGSSDKESAFLDASENGEDVFFLTSAPLVGEDYDASYDVYDAHVCSTQAPCNPASTAGPPPCSSTASCQPNPVGVTGSEAPLTSIFQGPGNPKPAAVQQTAAPSRAQRLAAALRVCAKKPRSKRAACVKLARRHYGPIKTKKSVSKKANK
jgi:WD40-like Beta Propeller Repeat